ncbi:MAG: response regulator [Lachnoclostridium sp.]|jgi:putative two-component system response regulator|nr:response regulator [Lachnoclostridium sp.]
MNQRILIVDDADVNRDLLEGMFENAYDVSKAENGKEALDIITKDPDQISIILLDLHMPVMNGFELLKELEKRHLLERIPVILITGDDSSLSERTGYGFGVSDVIKKPFDPYLVFIRVKNVIDLYHHKNHLEKLVMEQMEKIQHQAIVLQEFNRRIIDTLSNLVESRNLESGQHIKRIRNLSKVLLKTMQQQHPEYGLDRDTIEMIANASAMHDIGKIAIPDSILLKPGRLTKDEFEIMKTHSEKGSEIIKMVAEGQEDEIFYNYCYDIARSHHERYDGGGYPDGLTGNDIPLSAQIVSVVDVYDALISERVYKAAFSKEDAFEMIIDGECGTFSPKLMECFRFARSELERTADEIKEGYV